MPCLQEALHSMTAGPVPGPSGAPEVWPRLHEEEKRRADAADGRAERLKREKVQAHREARYWKAQWGRARNALEAARAEAEDLRRVSKDALHLRSEVDRLETLLAAIGVDTRKRSTMASLRIENGRLQAGSKALGKQLHEVESERDGLRSQVETLSRAQFGRKSERGHKGTGHKGTGHKGTGHKGTGHKGTGHKDGPQGYGPQGYGPQGEGRQARPAARWRDPRAHAAPRTGPRERGSRPAARGVALSVLQRAPGGQRIAYLGSDRGRGQGSCAGHRPEPLAQDLPVF